MKIQPRLPPRITSDDTNTTLPWHEAREAGDVNVIIMSGIIGRHLELEQTYHRQIDFVVLRIACNRKVIFRTREPLEYPNWTSWIAYGAMARAIVNRYYKGCKVLLEGVIRTDEFVRGGSEGKPPKRLRRETHVVKSIRMLREPKRKPRLPKDDTLKANFGVAPPFKTWNRKWTPNPADSFETFDPEGPMPDDARLAGDVESELPEEDDPEL